MVDEIQTHRGQHSIRLSYESVTDDGPAALSDKSCSKTSEAKIKSRQLLPTAAAAAVIFAFVPLLRLGAKRSGEPDRAVHA